MERIPIGIHSVGILGVCEDDDDDDTQKHHPKYQWYEEGTLDISLMIALTLYHNRGLMMAQITPELLYL